jgi:DNA repair exonuclease SbcCD nuclease subunit
MRSMKIVHAADLHIDSPLVGLARYESAPVERLRGATRRAFERLIELCIAEQASLLLIAGDVFDGDWRDYSTGLFFAAQLARLRPAGVQVVITAGNHDAQSQITRELRLPENVHVLSTRKPESVRFESLGVVVHGQGFALRDVSDDLAARYPGALSGLFNIGLLHTALGGRPGHAFYAPTSIEVLRSKGYDYWALGHVHTREVVSTEPLVIFPGNLQGRHARETGPKGATVLSVHDGRVVEQRHEVLDAVRWAVCEVDVRDAHSGDDAVQLARKALAEAMRDAGGRLLASRLILRGATRAHGQLLRDPERWIAELRAMSLDVGQGDVWLERVELETQLHETSAGTIDAPLLLDQVERQDALGQLVAYIDRIADDPSVLAPLAEVFADLRKKLPTPLTEPGEPLSGQASERALLRVDEPDFIASLLPEVKQLLLARLGEGEGA